MPPSSAASPSSSSSSPPSTGPGPAPPLPPALDLRRGCHPQAQCPLFSRLPSEIRSSIFAAALAQHVEGEEGDVGDVDGTTGAAVPRRYPEDAFWYRPGFTGPRRSSSALLRTCRRACLEGQELYWRGLEWTFWLDNGPPTPTLTGPQAPAAFLGSLTPRQARSSQVAHIHLFTPLHWLEDGHHLRRLLAHPALDNRGLRTLTLTIRHTDWWWWEAGAAPSMSDAWLRAFVAPPGLRELRVEYETLACGRRRPHLDAIVARNKRWRLRVRGGSRGADNDDDEDPSGASGGSGGGSSRTGGHLSAEHTQLEEWTWRGTSRLGGRTWEHLGEGPTVDYVVVRDTWRYVEGPIPDDALRRQHAQGWVVPSTEGGISPYKNSGGQEVVPYDEKYDDDGRL